jgi:uncharacterized membrane protein YgcG
MVKLPDNILIECLDALDRGEPIGAILSRYPQQADELRPILETTVRLGGLNLQPTVAVQTKSKHAFLTQAEGLKAGVIRPQKRPLFGLLLRPFLVIILIALFGLGFVMISGNALPGDTLYGTKLLIEGAQLSLTGNSEHMTERIRQNRVLEVEALLQQNREANVAFSGLIDETRDETWRIEGTLVAVAAAELTGDPQVGDLVAVKGLVTNGRLIASNITVINKNENPPTPTPIITPTVTAEPTRLPAQEPSTTPVNTPTVRATATSTSKSTPTPTLTIVPPTETAVTTAAPIATPDDDNPSDDDDDDTNSNPDDNSGSGSSNSGSGSSNSGSGSSNSGSGSGSDDD